MRHLFCFERLSTSAWLGMFLAAGLIVSSVACNLDRGPAVREMNKGIEAHQNGQNSTAADHLEEAMDIDPTYAEPALYLGQLQHRKLKNFDKAEQAYREAMRRDPDNPEIGYKLGAVLFDNEDFRAAAEELEDVVEKDPEHAKAWYRLGASQKAAGDYAEAVRSFMESIKADPRMVMDDDDPGGMAYHALGDLYNWYGFYDKALKVYENGIENNEGIARLYAGRGVAQLNLERFDEAIRSFENALEIDERHTSATFNLAVAYNDSDRHDQAVEVLEEYLGRAGDQDRRTAAQSLLGQLRAEQEEDDE